jgi:hypothetical protein
MLAIPLVMQSLLNMSEDEFTRVQKILSDMQRLMEQSKALAKRHTEIMKQYERLKAELVALRKTKPSSHFSTGLEWSNTSARSTEQE